MNDGDRAGLSGLPGPLARLFASSIRYRQRQTFSVLDNPNRPDPGRNRKGN